VNFFNAVASDLVEKRLWPVAAVLGAGAVAAPVAAHLTSAQTPAGAPPAVLQPPRPAPSRPSAAVQSLIAQLNPDAGVIPLRQGGFHDPFAGAGSSGSSSTASTGLGPGAAGPSGTGSSSSSTGLARGGPAASAPNPVHTSPIVPVPPVSTPRPVRTPRPTLPTSPSGSGVTVPATPPPPPPTAAPPPPANPQTKPPTTPPPPPPATPATPSAPSAPATPITSPQTPTTTHTTPTTINTTPATGPNAGHQSPASRRGGTHDALKVYSASLRFGQAASVQVVTNPVRLSPLPSAADPEIVYLGVMKGGKRAAFLVPRTAVGSGNGTCRPNPGQCQVVELQVGDTEFLDIRSPTAGLVQYELDLTHISSHRTSSRATAAKAHRRESAVGRELLKKADSTALAQLNFSPQLGAVYVRTKSAVAPATKPGQTRSTTSPVTPPPAPGAPQTPPAPAAVPAPASPRQSGPAPHSGS